MTKLPAPAISSRPMPPPAENTENTVRCEVSLASKRRRHGDARAHGLDGLRRHQRLAAQHAVLIAERKAHDFELAPLDLALDRRGGAALLGAPQVVAVDEAWRVRAGIKTRIGVSIATGANSLAPLAGKVGEGRLHALMWNAPSPARLAVDLPASGEVNSASHAHPPLAQLAAWRLVRSVFCQ